MWFVNPPDEDYGFLAHYLPYAALQIALGLIAIKQALFLIYTESAIPCGVGPWGAKLYVALLLGVTIVNQISAFAIVAKRSFLLDSANDPTHQIILKTLVYLYSFLAILMPIVFSAMERKCDYNQMTITVG
jgi:hypothetical protein